MNARDKTAAIALAIDIAERVIAIDWERVSQHLDAMFRGRVVMARHACGRGEHKYFSNPLPGMVDR